MNVKDEIPAIERALSGDPAIAPSPWFRARVMERLRGELELPPIAFPWQRVSAAIGLAMFALVWSWTSGTDSSIVPVASLLVAVIVAAAVARMAGGHARRGSTLVNGAASRPPDRMR